MLEGVFTHPVWVDKGGAAAGGGHQPRANLYSLTAHTACQLCGKQLHPWQITGPDDFIFLKLSLNKTDKHYIILQN